jgi:hypothetical protein
MGGKTSKETRTIVQNEIQIEIENCTENINKIVNETTKNVTTEILNKNASKIEATAAAENLLTIKGDLNISGKGSSFKAKQEARATALQDAAIKLVSDTTQLAQLGTQLSQDVANKLQNDQQAKASLDTLANISELQKSAGGPEGMVESIMTAIQGLGQSVTGGSSSTKTINEVKNTIKQKFFTKTVNNNEIVNKTNDFVKSSISNVNESSCKINVNASNKLALEANVNIKDGGEFAPEQISEVSQTQKCVITAINATKLTQELVGKVDATSTGETYNAYKADTQAKTASEMKNEKIQDSIFSLASIFGSMGSPGIGSVIVSIVFLIVIGVFVYFKYGKKSDTEAQSVAEGIQQGGELLNMFTESLSPITTTEFSFTSYRI